MTDEKARDGAAGAGGLDFLAIGAHPDDVELFCGATLAALARRGWRTGILHLTRGECGTRGTAETRAQESEAAAKILGVAVARTLDLGDGRLASSHESRLAVVAALRELRPRVVATHDAGDRRHPDHRAAHELVRDAVFLANVGGYPAAGERHKAEELVFFLGHEGKEPPRPDWIVDATETTEAKLAALRCYGTQFHLPGDGAAGADSPPPEGPATFLTSTEFRDLQENRARRWGLAIGTRHGEAFQFLSHAHPGHAFVRMTCGAGPSFPHDIAPRIA